MRKLVLIVFAAVAAFVVGACEGVADNRTMVNSTGVNSNANAVKPAGAAPTAAALLALESKAFEAWKNKDGKHFEGFLTPSFVGLENGKRLSKADEVKMISEANCEVKSYSLSEEKMTPVGPDAAVLTTKSTIDATCEGQKVPSPMISGTLFVRDGNEWKAAYHNQVAVIDPKTPPPPPPAKKDDAKAEPADAKSADALTDALMAVEKKGWDAWKARDTKGLEDVTTANVSYVDTIGMVAPTKADAIKGWTEAKCEIKSTALSDGTATSISPTVAILTFKGTAEGTCDGQPLGALWGTTIFLKEGDAWKAAYIFQNPA